MTRCSIIASLLILSSRFSTSDASVLGRQSTAASGSCPPYAPSLKYAVFGDAYASGDTYGSGCLSGNCNGRPDRDYDYGHPDLIRKCRRWDEAYAYQLKEDCSWTKGRQPHLDWPACSGSRFPAISEQVNALFSSQQAAGPSHVSQFATLQVGSSEAGIYEIANSCFFQADPNCKHDYGPAFPDNRTNRGECGNSIRQAIRTTSDRFFTNRAYNASFDAILSHPAVKNDTKFHLFVLGYAQLFKTNAAQTADQCSTTSWTTFCADPSASAAGNGARYGLFNISVEARVAANDAILELNADIQIAVANWVTDHDARISFVDIDAAFEGHRLCEPDTSSKPYTGHAGSWFWRGPKLTDFLPAKSGGYNYYATLPKLFNTSSQLDPVQVSNCSALDSTNFSFNDYAPWDTQLACDLQAGGQPVAAQAIGGNSDYSGPGGGGIIARGEVQRTLHPTADGHKAIYKVLVQAIRKDFKG